MKKELLDIYEAFVNNNSRNFCREKFKDIYSEFNEDGRIIKEICSNNDTYLKSSIIDAFYSTNLRRFNKLINIANILKKYNARTANIDEIINSINEVKQCLNDKEDMPFSFLTKYFALHRRYEKNLDVLPIYDSYVQKYINSHFFRNKKERFNESDKPDYRKFYNCMQKILEHEKVQDFDTLDNKIWFTAKLVKKIIRNTTAKSVLVNFDMNDFGKRLLQIGGEEYHKRYFLKIVREEINNNIKKGEGEI